MSRVQPDLLLGFQVLSFTYPGMLCASVLLTYDLSKCAQEAMLLWTLLMNLSPWYYSNCNNYNNNDKYNTEDDGGDDKLTLLIVDS